MLFIAVCVLTFVATASAECAWVLWSTKATYSAKTDTETWFAGTWRPERGFTGGWITVSAKKECEDALMAMVSIRSGAVDNADGTRSYQKYLCLPAAVDPRPK